jgi:hypothetical protein
MGLEGVWYNELGSQMTLSVDGAVITGTYMTAVGDAQGQYPLYGAANSNPSSFGQAVGWVVAWVNDSGDADSVTAWSGQYQQIDGGDTLTAMWLLTSETPAAEDWASTQVGQDVFTRQLPAPEAIARRLKVGHPSHPMKRS